MEKLFIPARVVRPDYTKLWLRSWPRHGGRSSRGSHILLRSTSSGKEKKSRSTGQPQYRSENTPATIEADHIMLAFQQLAKIKNSANLHNTINIISKLPKSLTKTMPSFDGKSEKFELFEDFFQTSPKIHNQLTEEDRINYFHFLTRRDALQAFTKNNGPTRENLGGNLAVFLKEIRKTPIDDDNETQIPET